MVHIKKLHDIRKVEIILAEHKVTLNNNNWNYQENLSYYVGQSLCSK